MIHEYNLGFWGSPGKIGWLAHCYYDMLLARWGMWDGKRATNKSWKQSLGTTRVSGFQSATQGNSIRTTKQTPRQTKTTNQKPKDLPDEPQAVALDLVLSRDLGGPRTHRLQGGPDRKPQTYAALMLSLSLSLCRNCWHQCWSPPPSHRGASSVHGVGVPVSPARPTKTAAPVSQRPHECWPHMSATELRGVLSRRRGGRATGRSYNVHDSWFIHIPIII